MELDTVDHRGKTPAHYAAKHGNVDCLKCLMKSAVDMNTGLNVEAEIILSLSSKVIHMLSYVEA